MKTKTVRFRSLVWAIFAGALSAAAGAGACAGEFKIDCPPNTVQVGGGDVDDVCVPTAGMGGGGGASGGGVMGEGGGGSAGGGGGPGAGSGGAPSMGSGGGGAPGEPCEPKAARCVGDAQQVCTGEGKWGEAQACDIACDGEGKACVVPVQLAAGSTHMCARLSDGTVRCWGRGAEGQLGNGAKADAATPVQVTGLDGVTSITADSNFACAMRPDGLVVNAHCWGTYSLSAGAAAVHPTPFVVETIQPSEALAMAGNFMCVVRENKTVECKGKNTDGQLGEGTTDDSPNYVYVDLWAPVQKLSVRGATACALLNDSTVACWGDGLFGQGGTGVPGQDLLEPDLVSGVVNARDVFTHVLFSCSVGYDDKAQCWGKNDMGQLGTGVVTNDIDGASPVSLSSVGKISMNQDFACAIKKDKTLWCWGANEFGELGNSCANLACITPVNKPPHIPFPAKVPLENVVDVAAAGDRYACALTGEGKTFCWGNNDEGQLGDGMVGAARSTPAPVRWK